MSDIIFISETEINAELKCAQGELVSRGYKLSNAIKFDKAIELLKLSTINIVLVNALDRKLEAYQLAKDIKEMFRTAIKVYVYLPNSNVNEASRFGLVNAEVEDQSSINNIASKLVPKRHREYLLDENITSIYSLNGGVGSSTITILLGYLLNYYNQNSLVIESSNNFTVKNLLNLNMDLGLLSRDRSKETSQVKDLDWFNAFIAYPSLAPKIAYLNLFSNVQERLAYIDQASLFAASIASKLEELTDQKQVETLFTNKELKSKFSSLISSIKLLSKDLSGESFTLFDEVLQLGSKISKNIFFDLSSDIYSNINKQLLRFSKNIIIVFKDTLNIKEQYCKHKAIFEKYKLNVIPVLAPGYHHYNKYKSLKDSDWQEILGDVPLIYPYKPEIITQLFYEHKDLNENESLFLFGKTLLQKLGIKTNQEGFRSSQNILKLLVGSNA